MKLLKSFGQFWYDFVIGDDWKIAVAVVTALAVVAGVMKAGVFGDHGLAVLGGVLVMVLFAVSLVVDVRPRKPKD
ncbi:MAG TPA: hypothetical protein VFT67_08875 [Jatrophihabitantaceae bacterium]|jgi:hypothetical protein|nr:hypothetical protein [Jatrophihabitantaceae bacterium]